jgi:hypothetical protein
MQPYMYQRLGRSQVAYYQALAGNNPNYNVQMVGGRSRGRDNIETKWRELAIWRAVRPSSDIHRSSLLPAWYRGSTSVQTRLLGQRSVK